MNSAEIFHEQQVHLLKAQELALKLLDEAHAKNLFKNSSSEKELNSALYKLADETLGIKKFWHKRIVRSGTNTLFPYRENPPDLKLEPDDILFIDFGPILDKWEADIGRTIVLGNDSAKIELRDCSESLFFDAREFFRTNADTIKANELYEYVQKKATDLGYNLGGWHCGHLIGEFPHEEIIGNDNTMYLHPENDQLIMKPDSNGLLNHWILEIHLINTEINRGAFFEQLLTDIIK